METGKRTNIGYEIIESCNIGSTEIVIGYNPDESAVPYVCWYCKGGNDYYWGKYCATLQAAREKLIERYQREVHIVQKTEVKGEQCNFIVVSEKDGCFHFVGAFECKYDATKAMVEDMFYRGSDEPHSDDYKEEFIKKWWLIRNVLRNTDAIKRGNEWEFQTTRTVIVTQEDIDEIMVLALEGGINYWCNEAEVAEDEYYGEFASEQVSRGGSLKLHDSEIDRTCTLTLDKFIKGVQLAIAEGYGSDWLGDDARLDTGMMDGEAADIIVQMALFGEVVYG